MAASGNKSGIASMFLWSGIHRFGVVGVSFLANIILARLLTPDDFGCIGILFVFIVAANVFVDGGLASSLIQKNTPSDRDYNTVFYWNLSLSIILYLLLFWAAPAISEFFKIGILCNVLRVEGLVLLLFSLAMVPTTIMRKQKRFKELAIINLSGSIISVIVAVIMAFCSYGVWSIVAQYLVNAFVQATLLILWVRWFPRLDVSFQSLKSLFGFGSFMLLSNLLNTLGNNIQGVIIGRCFSVSDVGYFTQAKKLDDVATNTLSGIVDQVSFPILSEKKDSHDAMIMLLRQIVIGISFITIPLMLCLIIIAHPIIIFLFSEKWIATVPYFQLLCLGGIVVSLQNVNYYAVASLGKSSIIFRWTVVKRLIGLLAIIGGIPFGVMGVVIGSVISMYISFVCDAVLTGKYVGYAFMMQIRDILQNVLLAGVPFVGFMLLMNIVVPSSNISILLIGLSYLLSYAVISIVFKVTMCETFKRLLFSIVGYKAVN